MLQNIVNFIKKVGPAAKEIERKEGFNRYFVMAQIALETGWLEKVSRDNETGDTSNNLFNIKGRYNGQYVTIVTTEFFENPQKGGKLEAVKILDEFRKYPNFEESIQDWLRLLKTPRYKAAYDVRHDLNQVAHKVHESGYATDPEYPNKIIRIANIIKNYEIIMGAKGDDDVYVVAKGDTLWAISRRFGVPMETIVRLNQLHNPDHIYEGQKLILRQQIHVVRRGDTLTKVANKYGTTVDVIVMENGIVDPDKIYVGQELIIPK